MHFSEKRFFLYWRFIQNGVQKIDFNFLKTKTLKSNNTGWLNLKCYYGTICYIKLAFDT